MNSPVTIDQTVDNHRRSTSIDVLEEIHDLAINISIYERDTSKLGAEIADLMRNEVTWKYSGSIDMILDSINRDLSENQYPLIRQDIRHLLEAFKNTTQTDNFKILLASINNNMCRKFHTDVNDLRLLCTYTGPGTLWLTDDNINRANLGHRGDNSTIVINEEDIRQVPTGAVAILKGAVYPQKKSHAVVHRSPTIEESGEKRLLLRIDTNKMLNQWP